MNEPCAVLVIGIQGAGKSSVGRALAARFERGAFIEGDLLWQMVVAGRVDMAPDPDPEAVAQLALRYRHGAMLSESFVAAGFSAVHADNIYGPAVTEHLATLTCPASLVVLRPRPEVVVEREAARGTDAYAAWVRPGWSRLDAARQFDGWLASTPRIGLWIDSSDLSIDETVDAIVGRWTDTFVV